MQITLSEREHPPVLDRDDWSDVEGGEHFVQFYESDAFLVERVSGFLEAGLASGEVAVVIATPGHRDAIEAQLEAKRLDVTALKLSQRLVALDAAETLGRFMVDGMPDETKFRETVGAVIVHGTTDGVRLRAFGEMVALLWAEGNRIAAIRLEELWNELGVTHSFTLFCAYPLKTCSGPANAAPFFHVCEAHSRVFPAESYLAQRSSDDRLRCVSLLQQKSATVDAEVAGRRKAELLTRDEQAKLELAIEASALGVWEFDPATGTFTASEQCKAHLGLRPDEELTYSRWIRQVHPDDQGTVETVLRKGPAGEASTAVEFRVTTPQGGVRWISSTARRRAAKDARVLGATLDVTERRSAAEALEGAVAERTSQLSETVGELEAFASAISHDLRTPLRSMRNYAEILRQECADGLGLHGRHYAERIAASAERMDRLIREILTFSRTTRTELALEIVDLDRLARSLVETYPNVRTPPAVIRIEGVLPSVCGNNAALTQCLSNLLDNAVKFVAPGVVPHIRILAEPGGGETIRLIVQDNGIGIPRDAQQSIFGLFQRVDNAYEGSGIGLATVQKALMRMGGRVGVSSEPGCGSTFWLELKRAEPAAV